MSVEPIALYVNLNIPISQYPNISINNAESNWLLEQ